MDQGLFFKRNTIIVADIDRALTIYRDILGFTVDTINDSADDSYAYPVFNLPDHAKCRFCALNGPDQERTFGFTEVKGVDLPDLSSGIRMNINVIRVKDIEAKMDQIKALGLQYTDPRKDQDLDGNFTFIEQIFIDYDGHSVMLYELI